MVLTVTLLNGPTSWVHLEYTFDKLNHSTLANPFELPQSPIRLLSDLYQPLSYLGKESIFKISLYLNVIKLRIKII